MSDPLFTPLKSHPSTWQAEVAQIKAKLQEAESAVEWADLRATQAVEEARELRKKVGDAERASRYEADVAQQAIDEIKALRARVAKLQTAISAMNASTQIAHALQDGAIADEWAWVFQDILGEQNEAFVALQEGGADG